MFIWTVINTVLVYVQFGQRITHWLCSFLSICSVSSNLRCFILQDWEAYTPPYFVCMPVCFRNNSFSTPVSWDLHLNFCSEMIKRNLERHNWRRMRTKRSKAFINFWVAFWYLYVSPLNKNVFMMFWYLCHTWVTICLMNSHFYVLVFM